MTKGLALNLTLVGATDERSLWVRGDRVELRRLLTNLIGNAIRYTDTGSVELRLQHLTRDSPEDNSIILEVEDTGIGVPPEEQKFLFERYKQGNHQRRGNGLGLYLSHQIVEAHHGTIKVESEVGKGSCFIVQFDLLRK
jgi:signal transduction histidine kinase